jgi:hypothetical protein
VRRGLAAGFLLVLAVSLALVLEPGAVARRWRLLVRSISGERTPPEHTQGFAFDPEYAAFLEDVRRRTPERATVAVLVSSPRDLHWYQAAYVLAPRRVVDARWQKEASYVAVYRGTSSATAAEVAIAHGTLSRR